MNSAVDTTGVIESARSIPLADALVRWRREATFSEFDTGRYRCRYYEWGRGQPLLFVHGICDRSRAFVPLIAHLTDSFHCIAYELPAGGADGARLDSLRHADLVVDLLALLDHLKVGQACLYGASFGSTVALRALSFRRRRFLRAALQCGFAFRRLAPAEKALADLARYWHGPINAVPLRNWLQRMADAQAFADAPPEMWDFHRANSATTPVRAFAQRARMIARLDLRALLPQITHPVLLITGDRDAVISRACDDELARGLPHADRLEFQACGHYPQYTHAAGVAEALRRFLLPPCGLSA
jgi:pimeloyl-ACP methyl ester carboxylesterase